MQPSSAVLAVTLLAISLSASFIPRRADADEPAGHITVLREIPAHDAFRPAVPGEATNIPTAREDIVVTSTDAIGRAPQSVSDATLGDVGGRLAGALAPAGAGDARVSPATIANPAVFAGTPLSVAGSAPAGLGTAITGVTSSIGTAVSGLAGLK